MFSFKELKRNLKKSVDHYPTLNVSFLGDTATQLLSTALQGMAIERGWVLDIFEADYNQIEAQVFNPQSELRQRDSDYIIVFQSTHKLLSCYSEYSESQRAALASDRIMFVQEMLATLPSTKIIYFNYPEIDDTVFGSYSSKVATSFLYQVRKLNFELMQCSERNPNLFLCDLASLQNKLGRDFIFQSSIYTHTEMVLSVDSLPWVASRVIDCIDAIQGKFKKCLILDLDNTLWGGVIGDDGIEHIQIGHGLGIGKSFTEFQQWVKKLKERGIILAVCSKNTEAVAKEPFTNHPEMVLHLDDFAVFMANWDNKVDNICKIQAILNIAFDTMVFLDDNPFERNMVRENIPAICVPELPDDPADYLEYLYSLNLFETASFSQADKDRTKQYQVEAVRITLQQSFAKESDFLKSLDMVSVVEPFNTFNTPRVAQLSQRSNQFNLRTVRYTEAEIKALSEHPDAATFSFTLEDKFGDNGLIGVLILKKIDSRTLFVDTWLMSCRVLKRGMEHFMLNTLVAYARQQGVEKIEAEYLPTLKNKMVENHYPNLGFKATESKATHRYELVVADYTDKESYITTKI